MTGIPNDRPLWLRTVGSAPASNRILSKRAARPGSGFARETAIQGGLLNGLVALSQQVLDRISQDESPGYARNGRASSLRPAGLGLKELA